MDSNKEKKRAEEEYFARIEFDKRKKALEEKHRDIKQVGKERLKEQHWMHCPKCGIKMVEICMKTVPPGNGAWGGSPRILVLAARECESLMDFRYRRRTALGSEFRPVHISPDLSSPQFLGETASITLIYQFRAFAFWTIKASSRADGPAKGKVTFDYLVWARESSGIPATYYHEVTSGSRLAKRMTKNINFIQTSQWLWCLDETLVS